MLQAQALWAVEDQKKPVLHLSLYASKIVFRKTERCQESRDLRVHDESEGAAAAAEVVPGACLIHYANISTY